MEYLDLKGKKVAVDSITRHGCEPNEYDSYYVGGAINRVVTIVYSFDEGYYLTDFFYPEAMDVNNYYCYHGFLILHRDNFKIVSDY